VAVLQGTAINVALIRGTTADPPATSRWSARRWCSMRRRRRWRRTTPTAGDRAGRAHRRSGSLDPRQVVVPGVLVDCVVLAPAEATSRPTRPPTTPPSRPSCACRGPHGAAPLDERKLIARRCAFELPLGGVVNLGIGVPEVVAAVAAEERVLDHLTLTAEPGVIGGMPQGGLDFGAAVNTQALLHQNQQFDFYDGGGLDLACLGHGRGRPLGNVNVSRFGPRWPARAASSTSARTRASWCSRAPSPRRAGGRDRGRSRAHRAEGRQRKFVESVQQVTFSGRWRRRRAAVLYVTERCVFSLGEGLRLVEVPPASMSSATSWRRWLPAHRRDLGESRRWIRASSAAADAALRFAARPAAGDRLSYDAERKTLFANFEGCRSAARTTSKACAECSRRCAAGSGTRSRWSSTTTASVSTRR
jgi:propionate CoA-transferase